MMEIKLMARVRQLLQAVDQRSPGDEEAVGLSEQGELLVALATSAYGETVRCGRAFEVHTTAAVAAVVAVPTTAVLLQIYNNEPDDGRAAILDRAWALGAAGTAAAGQAALIGALGQTRVASPAAAALTINALNGMGGKDTRVIPATAALDAVTGVAGNWRLLPGQTTSSKPGAAATPGFWVNANIDGRIVLPPGRSFGIHVLADVVGSTFTVGIEWHEKNVKVA
jgi:hypothetical protein